MASDFGGATSQVIWSDKGIQVMDSAPTDSEWFTHFMIGLCSRIGEHRKKDASNSIVLMIEMQRSLGLEWYLSVKQNDRERIRTAAKNGLFHIFTYCGSLRGYETPKVLLHDLRHQISYLEESAVLEELGNYSPPHVSLPLMGRFKARYQ